MKVSVLLVLGVAVCGFCLTARQDLQCAAASSKDAFELTLSKQKQVRVSFYDSCFTVMQIENFDTTLIKIPFSVERDKRIPCINCILIRQDNHDTLVPGYYLNDSLLLLPILDFSNRMLLFGLNFKANSFTQAPIFLETSIDAFVLAPRNKIITVNRIDYSGTGVAINAIACEHTIVENTLHTTRFMNIPIPEDISVDLDAIRTTILLFLLKTIH